MNTPGEDQADGRPGAARRARVEADLAAYAAEQRRLYGGIDELTLARYEAGMSPAAERRRVEQALRDHPALRECLDLSRELAEEWQAADSTPVPAFDPATIRMDPEGRSLRPPHPPNPVLRWLGAVAAAAAVIFGLIYWFSWRKPAPGAPPVIVKKGSPPSKKAAPVIVEKGKGATGPTLPKFEDAFAVLKRRLRDGIDEKEGQEAYDRLLRDYPEHRAEIESDSDLALALGHSVRPMDSPKREIVKKPEGNPPPLEPMNADRDALLAQIAEYGGKPLNVGNAQVRELREEVIRYQNEHPKPEIPEMNKFVAASEPTAHNELLYAEARADELKDAPNDMPEVRELRGTILAFRFRDDMLPLILKSKPLISFMNRKQPDDPEAKAAEMKIEVLALTSRFANPKERGPYLLCMLPPGIRGEAVALYNQIQTYAKDPRHSTDAILLDFVTRARRPVPQDTVGMIIPVYLYPNDANSGQWNQALALGGQGVRVKVVIAPNLKVIQDGDVQSYKALIATAHRRGIEVLGGVSCEGGLNAIAEVQQQIDVLHAHYAGLLDGLFFSSQGTDIALVKPYAALYRYARGLENHWQIVACPGSRCDEAFLTETGANILCSINSSAPQGWGWEGKYDPEHFAAIIENVIDDTLVPGQLLQAVEKHYGWVFIGTPGPLTPIPPYLGTELRWIQDINQRILNGNALAPPRRPTPKAAPAKTKGRK